MVTSLQYSVTPKGFIALAIVQAKELIGLLEVALDELEEECKDLNENHLI